MKQLVRFALPFMLSNLLQQVYTLTDMAIVGRFLGSVGLTATSNGSEIVNMLLVFCAGFSGAGQIIVSQYVGAGNREKLQKAIGTLFSFVFLVGLVTLAGAILFSDRLLQLLNVPTEAMQEAHNYAYMCCWGILAVFGYNTIAAILRGMGDSRHPTIFVVVSSAVNIVLDLLFVGGLGTGCFGAALATVLSQILSFLMALAFTYRNWEMFGFDYRLSSFRIHREQLAPLVRLGVPMALTGCAVMISSFFVNSFLNRYGVVIAAVTAVGNKITHAVTICTQALNTATSTMVGQNFGAGKLRRVSQCLLCCLGIGLIFSGLFTVLMMLFPERVFGLFDNSPEVLAMCHLYLPSAIVALSSFATRATAQGLINGVANSALSFITGILDGFIARIGLSYLLGTILEMGVSGYWMGSALAGHAFTIIGILYYLSGRWKRRKSVVA